MSIFHTESNEELNDKYYYDYNGNNDLSLFFDDNEYFFNKIFDPSTEEKTDNKESIEYGNIYNKCSIPDEPFKSQEKDINQNFNKSASPPDKENNNNINCTICEKSIFSNEKMDEKEIKSFSFLVNKRKATNENINKTRTKNETTKKTKTMNEDNKYNFSNILRTIKHFIIKSILDFINNKIKELYNNNIGNGIFKKQLQTLNQKDKSETNIKFNQHFIHRTIGDIFSNDISDRYTNYSKDYNKIIIENLLNEKNYIIKDYFTDLFNLEFKQCLEHYRGTNSYNVLNGMRLFEEDKQNLDDEYLKTLEYYLNDYENTIYNKKARKSRKNNTIKN